MPQLLEGRIREGFSTLRETNLFVATLSSVETTGKTQRRTDAVIFFEPRAAGPRVEMRVFRDGVFSDRFVGDGTTLWAYNAAANQYSARVYGRYDDGPAPENATKTLLTLLDSQAEGASAQLTRLARQLFAESSVRYIAWLPGVPAREQFGSVVYWDAAMPDRWVKFETELVDQPTPGWVVNKIQGSELRNLRGTARTVAWTIDLSTSLGTTLRPDFVFAPPANARAITKGN
ncbi:MAG: hypothetical protein ACOYON_00845 [Fimbriimonas sp.]